MDLRILVEPQQGATYDDQLRIAKATEDCGFSAFFRSDHFLRMGGTTGLPGPTDAWITLGALARETSRIRLGTLVTAATFRHPSALAIAVAQVDQMSGGRVEFGFGAGWFADEHTTYGFLLPPLNERFDRYAEQLEVITGLWATPVGQTFSFEGDFYRLDKAPGVTKPLQSPRPPIILGGTGKARTPALAARFANEFNLPFSAAAAARLEYVSDVVRGVGRDPQDIVWSAVVPAVCGGRNDAEVARRATAVGRDVSALKQNGIAGTPTEVIDRIGRFRDATGITRLYLRILDLTDLDHLAVIASAVAPTLD